MKKCVALGLLLFSFVCAFSQGTDCSTATQLTLDNVPRVYASVNGSGNPLVCGTNGTEKVSWFKFSTNSVPQCVDIVVEASPTVEFEVTIHPQCIGNGTNNLFQHNICAVDGKAHWATNLFDPLAANTTYYMRIRAVGNYTGNYSITGRHLTPNNNLCISATSLDVNWRADHNCCNSPSVEVVPGTLCATTLENTAWYRFTTANNQAGIINIRNLNCDNFSSSSSQGFQVGFFTGSCSSLWFWRCETGNAVNGVVQFTAPVFPVGTNVYVAIDGLSGSNCEYEIQAINAVIVSLRSSEVFVSSRTVRVRSPYFTDIRVFNALGQTVYRDRKRDVTISTENWMPGIYFVRLEDGRFSKTHTILVQK